MSMSAMSENYQKMWSWQPKPLSQNAGVTHNLQSKISEQNAVTGSTLSVDKQVNATTAQMFLNIMA